MQPNQLEDESELEFEGRASYFFCPQTLEDQQEIQVENQTRINFIANFVLGRIFIKVP